MKRFGVALAGFVGSAVLAAVPAFAGPDFTGVWSTIRRLHVYFDDYHYVLLQRADRAAAEADIAGAADQSAERPQNRRLAGADWRRAPP